MHTLPVGDEGLSLLSSVNDLVQHKCVLSQKGETIEVHVTLWQGHPREGSGNRMLEDTAFATRSELSCAQQLTEIFVQLI